jgi:iron complex outermembrane recepter protein
LIEQKGVYIQDLISALGDTVHFLIGGRYDWATNGTNESGASTAAATLATAPSLLDEAASPRVGIVYQPTPWLSFYGNYTTSFGENNGIDFTTHHGLPPQKGLQWEGGIKTEFFDKRLSATMAFYDITKTNVPIPVPSNPLFTTVAGAVESKGVEFDLTGRVNENWSLIANFSHDDVRVKEGSQFNPLDPTDIINESAVAGNRFPGVPANAGNLWVKYDALGDLKGLSVAGGLSVIGSMEGDEANSFRLPQYTLVNAMISYRFPWAGAKITAQLNVNNIFDTMYYPTAQSPFQIAVGPPRVILGSLRVEF